MYLICKQFTKISFPCEQKKSYHSNLHEKIFFTQSQFGSRNHVQTPYHKILQTRQSNETNSNNRIWLFQIRLPHTIKFSKPGIWMLHISKLLSVITQEKVKGHSVLLGRLSFVQ